MTRARYRSSIPADAVEVISERYPDGSKESAYYYLGDAQVGYRLWYPSGQLALDYGLKGGLKHGTEYHFNEAGHLTFLEPYRAGQVHGTARQWSDDGELLVACRLDHGVGLDLWCDEETGRLAEEHFWPADGDQGYLRQWNDDERTVWEEYYYVRGRGYHGIWREWNDQGKLRRGFPHYYVHDAKVSKRQYLRACEHDDTLGLYRPKEDRPSRKLPAEYVAQRKARG